jgi:hypothetical protein
MSKMMNKKGQLSFLNVLVFGILFIVFFSLALAPIVSELLEVADLSQLGTMGAFLIGSLNIWIFVAFILVVIMAIVMGLRQ